MVSSGLGSLGVISRGIVLGRARPPRRLGVISSGGGRIARAAATIVVGVVPVAIVAAALLVIRGEAVVCTRASWLGLELVPPPLRAICGLGLGLGLGLGVG